MSQVPPNHSNYYRPNPQSQGYGGARTPDPPQVTFDTLGQACQIVFGDLGTWIVVSLVYFLLVFAITLPISLLQNMATYGTIMPLGPQRMDFETYLRIYAIALPFGILSQGLIYSLHASVLEIAVRKQEGIPSGVQDIFIGFSKFPQMFVAGIISGVLITFGTIFLVVPALWMYGAFSFAPLLVIRQNVNGWQAIKISASALKVQGFMLFLLMFLGLLMNVVGVCVLCVGVLFTLPIAYVTVAINYYNFFPPAIPQASSYMGVQAPPMSP